jgi:PAS domain S-box-containing protein
VQRRLHQPIDALQGQRGLYAAQAWLAGAPGLGLGLGLLDPSSDTRHRAAIDQCIDTGEPTLTATLARVQDPQQRPGFSLYLPVYRQGVAVDSPAQRRAALVGVLVAPLVADELLGPAHAGDAGRLEFDLFDAATTSPGAQRMYASQDDQVAPARSTASRPGPPARASRFSAELGLPVAGRTLALRVRSTPVFEQAVDQVSPVLVIVIGALASGLLAALLHQQLGGRHRAEVLARRMTAHLSQLALVARTTANPVIITNAARRITWVNAGFERLCGYTFAEALGRSPGELLQFDGTDRGTVERMRAALDAGRAFSGAVLNRSKGGRVYMLELEIQPVRNNAGELTGFIALESDVTARYAAEAALRASQAEVQRIVEHMLADGHLAGLRSDFTDLASASARPAEASTRRTRDAAVTTGSSSPCVTP